MSKKEIPFVEGPKRKNPPSWRLSRLAPCLDELDVSWLADRLRKSKTRPGELQSFYMSLPTTIRVVRIEIDGETFIVNVATGQLYRPATGECLSSTGLSIKPVKERVEA